MPLSDRAPLLARLQANVAAGRHTLLAGPIGIGKTRLLRVVAETQPGAVWIEAFRPLWQGLLALGQALHARGVLRLPGAGGASEPAAGLDAAACAQRLGKLTVTALTDVVAESLHGQGLVLVLDQLEGLTPVMGRALERLLAEATILGATRELKAGLEKVWWAFERLEVPPLSREATATLFWTLDPYMEVAFAVTASSAYPGLLPLPSRAAGRRPPARVSARRRAPFVAMRAPTHAVFGLVFPILAGTVLGLALDPVTGACAVAGSLLPDVDSPRVLAGRSCPPLARRLARRYGHRTVTHSLLGWTAATVLALPLLALGPQALLAFSHGYLGHVLLDALNTPGVPLFYPSSLRAVLPASERLRVPLGARFEWAVLAALALLLAVLLLLHHMGFARPLHVLTRTPDGAIGGQALTSEHPAGRPLQPAGRTV